MLKVGIVGLPNVGKSTLFNALTKQAAESANFPFTTIEPNVGVVSIPDERLTKLAELSKSEKIVPTSIEFVDIAGLVKNAHQGEGLGNQFLSHIREVDAIAHVVRFFEDPNIIHVEQGAHPVRDRPATVASGRPVSNGVDPLRDVATVETELALADLSLAAKAQEKAADTAKGNDAEAKEAAVRAATLSKVVAHLADGDQVRDLTLSDKEQEAIHDVSFLTGKPTLYVANVSEEQITDAETATAEFAKSHQPVLPISVKIEQELVELDDDERLSFLKEYNLDATGLDRLIQAGYDLLSLITFLTTGPQETRAWTIKQGSTAPQAAGQIHSDMERGFIRVETVSYEELIKYAPGSPLRPSGFAGQAYAAARAAGNVRDEGKEYVVQDGDIMLFKFSV